MLKIFQLILKFKYHTILPLIALFCCLFFNINFTSAKVDHPEFKDTTYQAKYYNQSLPDPVTIEAGSTKEIIVRFKNTGTATWDSTGWDYVSVYTFNDKYRNSQFANSSWLSNSHPTKLFKTTKPNEIGEFKIKITAPEKAGSYKEEFYLSAENTTWIEYGYFYLEFKVVGATIKVVEKTAVSSAVTSNFKFNKQLSLGDKGEDVKQLQLVLKELGHYTYPEITGYYGPVTKQSVIAFQTSKGLSTPGNIGPQTLLELNKYLASKVVVTIPKAESVISEKSVVSKIGTSTYKSADYQAKLVAVNKKEASAVGGEMINLQLSLQNIGDKIWNGYKWVLLGVYNNNGKTNEVLADHKNWITRKQVINSEEIINKNDLVNLDFIVTAPHKKDNYELRFKLVSNNKNIVDSNFNFKLDVTQDAPSGYVPALLRPDLDDYGLEAEPNIKVGLYSLTEPAKFQSPYDYLIYAGAQQKGILTAKNIGTLNYSSGKYTFSSSDLQFSSELPIKLVATNQNNYFTITNYTRKVTWRKEINYNAYRGNLELNISQSKQKPYIVNELSLSKYMAGIAEVDNNSNTEYIKATLVAARSYAYYKIGKSSLPFDVYASTMDQLYLGYNSEVAMPNIAKATADTYGQMVTYKGEVVTTPYFGHSDGMTRTWSEAWGGTDKPWLQPVVAKYDKGLSMYGHGVGMSNRDASFRAVNDGWSYRQILQYYYTGVEVEQIY